MAEEPAEANARWTSVMAEPDDVVTVNVPEVAVPPGVVTEMPPLAAAEGTVAVICVSESTVNEAEALLKKLTELAPVRLEPVIVTEVPTGPNVGEIPLITGADALTVKSVELVAVPPSVVTEI